MFIGTDAAKALGHSWSRSDPRSGVQVQSLGTQLMSIPILPCLVFFPLPLIALVVAGLYLLALRVARIRLLPSRLPVRIAAASVFALLVALGTIDLVGDASALL